MHGEGVDLPESRLHVFIDEPRQHALYFLEAQKLIRDLALLHGHPGRAFAFFRDVVLSVQPLIALIKGGEQVGFYIDSETPLFRLKVEASHGGQTRATIVPPELAEFPARVDGLVRVETRYVSGREPYQSVLESRGLSLPEIVNRVLSISYQVKSALLVSRASDQSVLLHRLPPLRGEDETQYTEAAVRAMLEGMRGRLEGVLALALTDEREIVAAFAELGFRRIASRPVRFHCTCSRERIVRTIRAMPDPASLFDPGQDALEATCDYCHRAHRIARDELLGPPETVH